MKVIMFSKSTACARRSHVRKEVNAAISTIIKVLKVNFVYQRSKSKVTGSAPLPISNKLSGPGLVLTSQTNRSPRRSPRRNLRRNLKP